MLIETFGKPQKNYIKSLSSKYKKNDPYISLATIYNWESKNIYLFYTGLIYNENNFGIINNEFNVNNYKSYSLTYYTKSYFDIKDSIKKQKTKSNKNDL